MTSIPMITYNLTNFWIAVNKKPKWKMLVIERTFQPEVKSDREVGWKVLCSYYPDTICKE